MVLLDSQRQFYLDTLTLVIFFFISCRVVRRLNQCSTSMFWVQQHIKYMACQRHINYTGLNYGSIWGQPEALVAIRRYSAGLGMRRHTFAFYHLWVRLC